MSAAVRPEYSKTGFGANARHFDGKFGDLGNRDVVTGCDIEGLERFGDNIG